MKIQHIISLSGGKDSTAMTLLSLKYRNRRDIRYVFADTGNEHSITYAYLNYLESRLNIQIERIKPDLSHMVRHKRWVVDTKWRREGVPEDVIRRALCELVPSGNPFLDLCMAKGRFPSRRAQFCTQFLKAEAIENAVIFPLAKQNIKICSWQGVRSEESVTRANLPILQQTDLGVWAYRPILKMKVDQIFDLHRQYKVEPNPLYFQGMSRVGCMPCVNANKAEIREIAGRFPSQIERIADWELRVSACSKPGKSSFFADRKGGPNKSDIYEVVDWSRTSRGGKQFDLDTMFEPPACSSAYGLCDVSS